MAVRPFRLEELAEVLAFDFDEASGGIPQLNTDWRREDQEQALLSTCSSLISVVYDGESRVVQFSHFSVKEYLTSDRLAAAAGDISFYHIALAPAHTILAQACLGVLLHLDDNIRESYVERFPLVEYAAECWVGHAHFEDVLLRIQDGTEHLFDTDKPHLSRWIRVYDIDNLWWPRNNKWFSAAPVYYAALCGFSSMVEKLLRERPKDVNARGGSHGTALHAASIMNHVNVGQSLLKRGADVNVLGRWKRTPLHVASTSGNLEIGQWLLANGADVNAKDDDHWTPLHGAANNGHVEFVRTLLRTNTDINAQTKSEATPLYRATNNGHVSIVRLLLDSGADPNKAALRRWTPLHEAACFGRLEVAHLLLEGGVDVDAEDDEGKTAFQIALRGGLDELAQLLSRHRVEKKT